MRTDTANRRLHSHIDAVCQSFAKKYNIPYFDLGTAMTNDFNKRDYNTVKKYYMGGAVGGSDSVRISLRPVQISRQASFAAVSKP